MMTDLACATGDFTSVTLYDTLGVEATEFIINQCELTTIFCTSDKIAGLAQSKIAEKIPTLTNLVIIDKSIVSDIEIGEKAGIKIY